MDIKKAAVVAGMGIRLRNAEVSDAEFILSLRTDPQLNQHISAVSGSLQQQIDFLEKYSNATGAAFFIIEDEQHRPLGTIRLYDPREDSFCWGSWIVAPTSPARTGTKSALLVYCYGFDYLGFRNSHFDVRQKNERVWKFHESWGAELTHQTEEDRFYVLSRETWHAIKSRYKSLFSGSDVVVDILDS